MSTGLYIIVKPGVNMGDELHDRVKIEIDPFRNCKITLMEGAVYCDFVVIECVNKYPVNTITIIAGGRHINKLHITHYRNKSVTVIDGRVDRIITKFD